MAHFQKKKKSLLTVCEQHFNVANFPLIQVNGFRMAKKNTYLHLVQIIWNNLVVLFYLSVHTDVSISCLFLCTYTSKYFHNVHYFPPSVSSFLPQSVVLKKYIRAIQCVQYSTSSTAQWGRTSLKCWKTHWCWSDTGFLIAVVSKGTPLHKWLVLKGISKNREQLDTNTVTQNVHLERT